MAASIAGGTRQALPATAPSPANVRLLQGGIYFVECYPGPNYWDADAAFGSQCGQAKRGHVLVPDVATLMDWIRVGYTSGFHTAWHPARSAAVQWQGSNDVYYYRCGDCLVGHRETGDAIFDICYDASTVIGCNYDMFDKVIYMWRTLSTEFARQVTGAILGKTIRLSYYSNVLHKMMANDDFELAAYQAVKRIGYEGFYVVDIVDNMPVWEHVLGSTDSDDEDSDDEDLNDGADQRN